jgi:hypothetical protein
MSDTNETPTNPLSPEAIEAVIEAATFTLSYFPEKLAIVNLAPGAEVPKWAEASSLFSITATATETSLICATRSIPAKTPAITAADRVRGQGPAGPRADGRDGGAADPAGRGGHLGVPALDVPDRLDPGPDQQGRGCG